MFVLDPLHDYVVVESAPDVMQRIALSDPDAPAARRIVMPTMIALGGIGADAGTGRKGNQSAVTTLLAGRVLWVGAGKHRDGAFVVPKLKARDVVLFMPRTVSYEFLLHGRDVKILPYAEIVSSVREVPVDSREWLDFLDLAKLAMAANDAQEPAAEAV